MFPQLLGIFYTPSNTSNNVPCTDYSIGCDTALNVIVESCDTLKQSGVATRKRIFIMEVMGGRCGYLGLLGSIAGGAQIAYLPEQRLDLKRIFDDKEKLKARFANNRSTSLIILNEKVSKTYNIGIFQFTPNIR